MELAMYIYGKPINDHKREANTARTPNPSRKFASPDYSRLWDHDWNDPDEEQQRSWLKRTVPQYKDRDIVFVRFFRPSSKRYFHFVVWEGLYLNAYRADFTMRSVDVKAMRLGSPAPTPLHIPRKILDGVSDTDRDRYPILQRLYSASRDNLKRRRLSEMWKAGHYELFWSVINGEIDVVDACHKADLPIRKSLNVPAEDPHRIADNMLQMLTDYEKRCFLERLRELGEI